MICATCDGAGCVVCAQTGYVCDICGESCNAGEDLCDDCKEGR